MDPAPFDRSQVVRLILREMRGYATKDRILWSLFFKNKIPFYKVLKTWTELEEQCPPFFEQYRLRLFIMEQRSGFGLLVNRWTLLLQGIQLAGPGGLNIPQIQAQLELVDLHSANVISWSQKINNIKWTVLAKAEQAWTTSGDGSPSPLLEHGMNEVALQQVRFNEHLRQNARILQGQAIKLKDCAHEIVRARILCADHTQQLNAQVQQLLAEQAWQAWQAQELNGQVQQLTAQNQQLQAQHSSQTQQLQAHLNLQVQQYNDQTQRLALQVQELQGHNELLQSENVQLQAQHAQHAQELYGQHVQHAQQVQQNDQLQQQNQMLHAQLHLQAQMHQQINANLLVVNQFLVQHQAQMVEQEIALEQVEGQINDNQAFAGDEDAESGITDGNA